MYVVNSVNSNNPNELSRRVFDGLSRRVFDGLSRRVFDGLICLGSGELSRRVCRNSPVRSFKIDVLPKLLLTATPLEQDVEDLKHDKNDGDGYHIQHKN
jgi:hypothetical protein